MGMKPRKRFSDITLIDVLLHEAEQPTSVRLPVLRADIASIRHDVVDRGLTWVPIADVRTLIAYIEVLMNEHVCRKYPHWCPCGRGSVL